MSVQSWCKRRTSAVPQHEKNRRPWLSSKWPLLLRFSGGSIHTAVLFPVLIFAAWSALIVYLHHFLGKEILLPSSLMPSLSIVVGLELVFRNTLAYNRFWSGRLHLNTVTTSVRCLCRGFLTFVPPPPRPSRSSTTAAPATADELLGDIDLNDVTKGDKYVLSDYHAAKTVETIKVLIAMLYTLKEHMRADWSAGKDSGIGATLDDVCMNNPEFAELLPIGMKGHEHRGLSLTLQLATFVEKFVQIGIKEDWLPKQACTQIYAQLNNFTGAYGNMEVIRLAPTPVAHLIHSRQVLAVFCILLPFAVVENLVWVTVPLCAYVAFTLYGIECIASWHDDPFGTDKIDINMDEIVDDAKREAFVMLTAWENHGGGDEALFAPQKSQA